MKNYTVKKLGSVDAYEIQDLKGEEIVLDIDSHNSRVYMRSCENCTLLIRGKVTQITIEDCKKTSVGIEGVIVSLEIINSKSIISEIGGTTPLVMLERCYSVTLLYLNEIYTDSKVVSTLSYDIFINKVDKDGDTSEYSIPIQLATVWNPKKGIFESSIYNNIGMA